MRTNVKGLAVLVVLVVLTAATLGGVAAMYGSVQASRKNTSILRYNARRNDCIRRITADAEQDFRQDLTAFIAAGASTTERDERTIATIVARMHDRANSNYADAVTRHCQPAIEEIP